jgi:hypothetical protein
VVNFEVNNLAWKFTDYYGNPEAWKRNEGWSILRHLSTFSSTTWLYIEDFNEILAHSEKFGVVLRPQWQMKFFIDTVDFC